MYLGADDDDFAGHRIRIPGERVTRSASSVAQDASDTSVVGLTRRYTVDFFRELASAGQMFAAFPRGEGVNFGQSVRTLSSYLQPQAFPGIISVLDDSGEALEFEDERAQGSAAAAVGASLDIHSKATGSVPTIRSNVFSNVWHVLILRFGDLSASGVECIESCKTEILSSKAISLRGWEMK